METSKLDIPPKTRLATGAILIATILWGSTFIIIKLGIQSIPPFMFQGMRHIIGLMLLLPFIRKLRNVSKISIIAGICMGIAVMLMLTSQTIALQTANAGKGSFIYALYIPMTPFFARFFLKSKILGKHWISIGLALSGLIILVFGQYGFDVLRVSVVIGDFWMLIGAIIAAFQIILTEYYVKRVDLYAFVFFQMLTTVILFFGVSFLTHEVEMKISFTTSIWIAIIFLGLFTTCLTGFLQAFAQRHISSTRAALIYSMEPVFATVFAVFFGDESLNWMFIIGGIFILAGVLLSSVEWRNKSKQ